MSNEILLILGVIIVSFAGLAFFVHKKFEGESRDSEAIKMVTEWMKEMRGSLENRLDKNTTELNTRLDKAAALIGGLQKELGSVNEFNRSMRDFLSAPKTRGNFSETMLEQLLSQHLPHSSFKMQYKFKSGETVDAMIELDGRILCIDSKFPLENFNAIHSAATDTDRIVYEKSFVRDVKKHIDDIAKKYILPQGRTYDFALMYVPSEAVYYEILRNDAVMEHARIKQISLVSPQAMYYYIHIVAQALKGQKVNAMAMEVMKYFSAIKTEAGKFGRELDVLSRHITNAKSSLDGVNNSFGKLNEKVERASELQAIETKVIEESLPGSSDKILEN